MFGRERRQGGKREVKEREYGQKIEVKSILGAQKLSILGSQHEIQEQ